MNKQKILNWIGGIWFIINLPIIPFAGSIVYALISSYFISTKASFIIVTFAMFSVVLFLSKIWLGKFIKAPVILSLIPFLYATLQLLYVQDYLTQHTSILFGVVLIVFVVIICIAVVKAMRGELNKDI